MNQNTLSKVAVLGLGTMGAGIAEVFAKAGFDVCGIEYNEQAVERGRTIIAKSTERAVSKGKMSPEDQQAMMERLKFSTNYDDVADCQLIVEAVFENAELKESIFRTLDEKAPADAILATNTSSLSITRIASVVKDPTRVVGVHFFNPAPVQKLVEVIRTVHTSAETVERLVTLLSGLGKSPVVCGDRAGFIVNTLLVPYVGSSIRVYQDGLIGRDDLDRVMVERAGYPMGPLTLSDLIGNDVNVAVLERVYEATKDARKACPELLDQLVQGGLLGRKSGRGFYTYEGGQATDAPGPVAQPAQERPAEEICDRLLAEYLNEALKLVQIGYAKPNDIDTGMALGCRMPKPFDVLAEMGPQRVLEIQRTTFDETAQPGDRPTRLLEQLADAADPQAAVAELRQR